MIEKGIINAPLRAVIYGPEGIGKSTLASQFPGPVLFVDVEGGTLRLNVDRERPETFAAVEQIVAKPPPGYKTMVFDTADWLEKLLTAQVCALHNQNSIEGFGYGKGFVYLNEAWKTFLDSVRRMQAATGMHVVFTAHAWLRKQELPDEGGSFDRWELKLAKNSPAILKEWADAVLFINYRTIIVETDGKNKARGGERIVYTTHHACWDAKNRFGLASELPLDIKSLSPLFATVTQPQAAPSVQPSRDELPHLPPKAAAPVHASAPATNPINTGDPAKDAALQQLAQLMTASGVALPELQDEMARLGVVPAGTNPRDYNMPTLTKLVARWSAIATNIGIIRKRTAGPAQ